MYVQYCNMETVFLLSEASAPTILSFVPLEKREREKRNFASFHFLFYVSIQKARHLVTHACRISLVIIDTQCTVLHHQIPC
jgi:hypothetical protein